MTDWLEVAREYAATGRHGLAIGARQIVAELLQVIEQLEAAMLPPRPQPYAPDVFISYDAPDDRPVVTQLAAWLERRGRRVWWDRELVAGTNFSKEIDLMLARAKAVVVIWTPTSCRSGWVRREAVDALGRGVLVPVLLGLDTPPLGFQGLEAVNLTGWDPDWSHGHPQLLDLMLAIDGLCDE
jgi:TIR domain